MTERDLLERFATDHDEESFRTLVERHGRMVLSVCQAVLTDPRHVEDAFQRTFLLLARKAGTIRNGDLLGPWLHRAALRVARQTMTAAVPHRARRRPTSPSKIEIEDDRNESGSGRTSDEKLGRLTERDCLSLVHCDLEGDTNAEAASKPHCPVRIVEGKLGRARESLCERLSRHGVIASLGRGAY